MLCCASEGKPAARPKNPDNRKAWMQGSFSPGDARSGPSAEVPTTAPRDDVAHLLIQWPVILDSVEK